MKYIVVLSAEVWNSKDERVLSGDELAIEVDAQNASEALTKLGEKLRIAPPVKRPPADPPGPVGHSSGDTDGGSR